MHSSRPYLFLSLLTILLLITGYIVQSIYPVIAMKQIIILAITFYLVSLIFLILISNKNITRPQASVRLFLGASFLKMILYFICLFALVAIFKQNRIPLIITFMAFYLVYTPFDVWIVLKYFRKKD
jgi:hypothetical protein